MTPAYLWSVRIERVQVRRKLERWLEMAEEFPDVEMRVGLA